MNFLNEDKNELDVNPQVKAIIILFAIVAAFVFLCYMTNHSARLKDRLEEFSKVQVKYVVTEKGIDSSNRNSPFIVYNGNRYHEYEMIWEKIEVGDSLYKPVNSYQMSIYKKDTVILVDYNDVQKYYDSVYARD